MKSRSWIVFGAALALTLALPVLGRADGKDGKDNDRAAKEWTVNFGQPQPQTPDAAPVGAAVTHFLDPNDLTIVKGDSVNFIVNGGGHGIAIHPVSKKTTRADIAEDLCDGNNNEANDANNPAANRRARAAVCNGTVTTPAVINGVPVIVVGTQNLDYMITDGKDNLIIEPGFNVPAAGANNPRLDDTEHTHRLLGTSGRSTAGDTTGLAAIRDNPAGAFLTGSAAPATVGNRINVQFLKTGRYLVICMNRGHSLNDHMFGFVNVVGDDED
jgi:plastocyanin